MTDMQTIYRQHIAEAAEEIRKLCLAYAAQTGASPDGFAKDAMELVSSGFGRSLDSRAIGWRARCRLYTAVDNFVEPIADTDPTLDAVEPGAAVFAGLPAVGVWAQELGADFHKLPCEGLSQGAFGKKIRGLRTQLSAAQSNYGTMRVDYRVTDSGVTTAYLCRIDVERAEGEQAKQQFRRTIR